jgi:HD-GYP domain-containing protein (c-di-GMP phosphodiesterase class II)
MAAHQTLRRSTNLLWSKIAVLGWAGAHASTAEAAILFSQRRVDKARGALVAAVAGLAVGLALAAWLGPSAPLAWAFVLLPVPAAGLARLYRRLRRRQRATRRVFESMADAVDVRDPYTGGHSRRVGDLVMQLLRGLRVSGPEARLIEAAARLHDIGKISVPDEILNHAGPLTPYQRRVMEQHAVTGAGLLARHRTFVRAAEIVLHHHERWDGKGYPAGLRGAAIPLGARVIAVADSFDAMTSTRPYRAAMTAQDAAAILRAGRGTQWDMQVVDVLLTQLETQVAGDETRLGTKIARLAARS